MTEHEKEKCFAEKIKASKNIVFFGGAGVSTESGMKDYRSKDGIYSAVKEYGIPPETILSHDFLMQNPETFYKFYAEYFLGKSAKPNKAHKALARLEEMGKVKAVITQNIDGLHQAAGSKNVIELHGTTSLYYCTKCGAPFPKEEVERLNGAVPYCSCGAFVRPRVTMYGEMLDTQAEDRAISALSAADMLIVGGTSLAVYPAAAYLHFFKGDTVAVINRDETFMDKNADFVFRDKIGDVFKRVMELLD